MAYAIARVKIGEFDQFIETFSTRGKAKRAEHGCRGATVYRNAEDAQEIVSVFDWDRDGVEAFMADPEAREIMTAAGLQGPPEFTFVEHETEFES